MSGSKSLLGYLPRESPVHNLTGATKLIMTILCSIASMITYDTRFLLGMIVLAAIMFRVSKVKIRDISFILKLVVVVMLLKAVIIFLFSPEEGVKIYGTRHEIAHLIGRYTVTKEQLFYLFNVILKYFSVLPMALIFITTTQPSEFASSLNKLGVSYKVAYSVALALRYIPDVQKDFREISQAQQARGVDVSKNVGLFTRLRNTAAILLPLLFSSLDRIDTISNAMELRGFGKHDKRTWYSAVPFKVSDFIAMGACVVLVVISLSLNFVNGGRYYNPFI